MIKNKLERRHLRIRKKIQGTPEKPRLCVKRSNKYIYAILTDDSKNKIITTVSSLSKDIPKEMPETDKKEKMVGKSSAAYRVGLFLAQKAKTLGINSVVFDRAGYRYHGRVKALAEGARKGGLKF
jgi:large subunit ribosomal protein L18